MNKKVLYSIVMIAVVASLAVAGTYAYLTATRTTSSNRFAAGTLDLDVKANGNKLEPFVIENMGGDPNVSGTKTWTVENTGTLPGRLLVRLQNVVNTENGCNDQERAVEPDCDDEGNEGDLGKVINLKIALDGVDKVQSTLATDQASVIGRDWAALPAIVIPAGESRTVTAHWSADENSYGNEIQSDAVQFDFNFRLIQLINGETPEN